MWMALRAGLTTQNQNSNATSSVRVPRFIQHPKKKQKNEVTRNLLTKALIGSKAWHREKEACYKRSLDINTQVSFSQIYALDQK